ncbi:hypothetical protein EAY45_24775, partial [Vibrio anguillarum]|nr:hypothetical protein [Vibrio anguillarum]
VAGFVLFRFFDMLKPWPISWLDKRVVIPFDEASECDFGFD